MPSGVSPSGLRGSPWRGESILLTSSCPFLTMSLISWPMDACAVVDLVAAGVARRTHAELTLAHHPLQLVHQLLDRFGVLPRQFLPDVRIARLGILPICLEPFEL